MNSIAKSAPAPGPYDWEATGLPNANGSCHLYIVDKTGRKIAAIWGKAEEKEATATLFAAAHDLLDSNNALLGLLDLLLSRDDMPGTIGGAIKDSHRVAEARAAIAKATGAP